MSADNYLLIRRHPKGGFAVLDGCASHDGVPTVQDGSIQFRTIQDAVDWTSSDEAGWTEYGTHIHEECNAITIVQSPFDLDPLS